MTPAFDGKLFTVDLRVLLAGVTIKISGTVEMLDIRRQMEDR